MLQLTTKVISIFLLAQILSACIFIGTNHAERQLLRSQDDSKNGRCDQAVAEIKDAMTSSDVEEASLAYMYMAGYYREGKCVPQSADSARYYYQKSAALKGNWNGAVVALACLDGPQSACDSATQNQIQTNQQWLAANPMPPPSNPFQAGNDIYAANIAAINTRRSGNQSVQTYTPPQSAQIANTN